ncbi:hypothetical protein [Mycolicibacterium aubagnense]|uniref:hypothetical protein n=1 Tax=Mycolicibacterium aubagnense TaxID=319707 RepID=UPI0010FDE8C0|nr:hypothetical protein [Mycolicibacterium aubagnense]WGI34113.1 hypothetical protein QDT91_07100 [Mycolicibacterium aubagnense]
MAGHEAASGDVAALHDSTVAAGSVTNTDAWAHAALFTAAGLMLILGGVLARCIGSRWATAELVAGAVLASQPSWAAEQ